jgi:predicted Zn-dependent protease
MKLSDWASIAEILSGIAVVITLVFLIVGIRDNTEATRAASYERTIDSMNEWRMWLSSDDELREAYNAWFRGDGDQLSAELLGRVGWATNVLWAIYEKTYYANQYGTMGRSEWDRTERNVCVVYGLMDDNMRSQMVGQRSSSEFAQYVRETCRPE